MKEINIVTLLRNFGPKKMASNQMSAEVFFGIAHILAWHILEANQSAPEASNQRQPSHVFAYCCHEHWVQTHFQSGLWLDRGVAC